MAADVPLLFLVERLKHLPEGADNPSAIGHRYYPVNDHYLRTWENTGVTQFITNGFKVISRLDRDIGILIDNCLGFLYSIDLEHEMRKEIGQIESALYDKVYLGRTPEGCRFKETLFRIQIVPLMKRLAPVGYYFGIHPDNTEFLGYWELSDTVVGSDERDSLISAHRMDTAPAGSSTTS